jgi:hypothetical protein
MRLPKYSVPCLSRIYFPDVNNSFVTASFEQSFIDYNGAKVRCHLLYCVGLYISLYFYLFIFCLFNDAASSSDYVTSNDRIL